MQLYLISGIAGLLACIGAFFYGQHTGVQKERAAQLVDVRGQFQGFVTAAGAAAAAGTAAGLKDFQAQAGVLQSLAADLQTTNGIMNNAASRLASSLRNGGCFLTGEQRRLLECVRRPRDSACTAPNL